MGFFQETAVDISRGINFLPQRMRYRLPENKNDTSVYLLSDSFEYDIQLIKDMPSPKMNFKNIIIPYRIVDRIGVKPFRYNCSSGEYNRKLTYLSKYKLMPQVMSIRFPYPKIIKDNLYISMSDIIPLVTPFFRIYTKQHIQENIFGIFDRIMKFFNFSKNKYIIIDTKRYKIYKELNQNTLTNDIINSLLTAYMINPVDKIKKLDYIIIFRSPEADYKFDLSTFEKRDVPRMRTMLNNIGVVSEMTATSNEEVSANVDGFTAKMEPDINIDIDDDNSSSNDNEKSSDVIDEIKEIHDSNDNPTQSIQDTINKLSSKYGTFKNDDDQIDNENNELYNVKTMDINARLIKRINPNTQVVSNYKKITDAVDVKLNTDNSVEGNILKDTMKNMSSQVVPADEVTAMTATTSAREKEIREKLGKVKLNNITFDTLTSVTDVPKPKPIKLNKLTTTNPGAIKGSQFAYIAEEYEEKLLDRDIVATFMNFSKLPDGFYVTDVQVTDISTVTTLMNNWKITLKNKLSDKQSVINLRIPKVINGRFFNNGIWYNIGKQDFPIPILKINKKTVMLTSNYNKITCTRYDTRSLVDLGMMVKVIEKLTDDHGVNKYVKVGSSSSTNSRFISTIEYDEYASRWLSFINEEAKLEILFNRSQCLKNYSFVTVNDNEFCCGMIDQVPIVINTETGLTRDGETLTDTILQSLPEELKSSYRKQKPGKMSMYSEITIGITLPLGVAIAAWEGLTQLLKKSNVKYQYVDSKFDDPHYFVIPFKDKNLAIENSISNQLLYNGFYRINTKAYMISDFETPIMNTNSTYVDIFNQLFFKQYSQLTTFITYYHFFVDAITADVCNHYHIPNDISGMLIYASNLLADNNHTSENNAALYRIRSSEIIPAIIHHRLAFAISKYNNSPGTKSRGHALTINPNEIMNELLAVPNVEPMSALNPMNELHLRENITKKGFKGVNSDRSYTKNKRTYEDSMIGKVAISSPNSANVGISRQLVADPKIESVRGYTSSEGVETNFNDLQLASFSELITPGTVTRDDAIRTAIATSQTSHIVSTAGAQPCLVSNGVDEIVPAYLTEEFSYVAREDGDVIDMNDDYMIIRYKSGKKKAINISHKQSANTSSGFYVDNKLDSNFNVGDKFKEGDILAYHPKYFSKDSDGMVRLNIGPLAKVAFTGLYSTYEDAGLVTTKMSKKLGTTYSMMESIKISATDNIESIVKVGDEIEVGDPLVVFGLGDTGDKSIDNFLRAFIKDDANILDNAKRIKRAKNAGTVVDVRMYTTKSMDKLSPSLFKIFDEYFKNNVKRRQILDKYDKTNSVYKMDTLYSLPTEPLKGSTIKGITCDVLVEIFIEHTDEASVGDKLAMYGASKQILSEVIPEGLEPFSEDRPEEEVSLFVAPSCVLKRMIPSLIVSASANKVLLELKRSVARIWEEK